MKKLNKLFILFVSISLISCVEDTALSDQFDDGPNLVGFVSATKNASVVADGSEQDFLLTINLTGPTSLDMSGDISVTVEIDESTTAIEGVHYKLASKELTLSENTNYIGNLPLTVITDGIAPPLEANPKLVLNISEISSDSVVPNGRTYQTAVTLEYLCFSILSGKYSTESAAYYRIGTFYYDENDWPEEMEIIYVCDNTYRVLEWVGPFDGNEWYFTAPTNPCSVQLILVQDGVGSRTATWPASVDWPGGTAPTLSTGASDVDIVSCLYDGTTYFCTSSLDFS